MHTTLGAATHMSVPRAPATAALISTLTLLGACGTTVTDNGLSSAPPRKSAPSGSAGAACTTRARSVCVTTSANGHTVAVGVGWMVEVNLYASNSRWSSPLELGAHLLRQLGGVRRDDGAVRVAYRSVAPGRTNLRAFERPVCPPARICPQFILAWEVHIRVTGR